MSFQYKVANLGDEMGSDLSRMKRSVGVGSRATIAHPTGFRFTAIVLSPETLARARMRRASTPEFSVNGRKLRMQAETQLPKLNSDAYLSN